VCPAYLSGKPLSPKKLHQDIKEYWLERAPIVMAAKCAANTIFVFNKTTYQNNIFYKYDDKAKIKKFIFFNFEIRIYIFTKNEKICKTCIFKMNGKFI